MAIDENRIKHIKAVARVMKEKAKDVGLDEKEMFTLGLLHDIGYEFAESETHHTVGAEILKSQNYKYFREVLHHGKPDCGYSSSALDLLNFADMSVDKAGNVVGFEKRLEDIKSRRGENSIQYQNCLKVVKNLKEKGF